MECLLIGKESEYVCEEERYGLAVVGFICTHNKGTGTKLLDDRTQVGVGLLISPRLNDLHLDFCLSGQEVYLHDILSPRKEISIVCAYAPSISS